MWSRGPMTNHRTSITAAALVAVLVTGCTSGLGSADGPSPTTTAAPSSDRSTTTADSTDSASTPSTDPTATTSTTEPGGPTTEPVDPDGSPADGTLIVGADCRPRAGVTITQLPDVVAPPVRADRVVVDDATIAGELVPGFEVPAVSIDETIDGGCVLEHDAPGGCLGAVEITGGRIPAAEIPGFEIPGFDVGSTHEPPRRVPVTTARAVATPPVSTPQVCQQKPRPGSTVKAAVVRPAVVRAAVVRAAAVRPTVVRPAIVVDGEAIDATAVDAVAINAVALDAQAVDAEVIDAVVLPDTSTQVFDEDDQTSYSTAADVLFDFDRADLKPDALATLRAIAADIEKRYAEGPVRVEGHTDAVGSDSYNRDLSLRRAESVRTWLVTEGGIAADRVAAEGYGESLPVVPNAKPDGSDDPTGRARNRRVVITAGTP